jgi:hypothetical protein
MESQGTSKLIQGGLATGIINALINGIINWFQVRGQSSVRITVDSISNNDHTVMGGAVLLALLLSVIIASIAWLTIKVQDKPRFFPGVAMLILKNAFFLFGLFIVLAILWQRFAGSVEVAPVIAAILTGIFAGIVAGVTDFLTRRELIR